MRRLLLTLAVAGLLPIVGLAVGTRKKKQTIHVRREFFAGMGAVAPVEFHNDSNAYHSLRCKNNGLEKCGWKRLPPWRSTNYSLDKVDEMVRRAAGFVSGKVTPRDKPGMMMLNNEITIRWWRLPTGYEYTVEEGGDVPPELDSITRAIQHLPNRPGKGSVIFSF